jgi:exodeoxyribonuclease V alpha subunit
MVVKVRRRLHSRHCRGKRTALNFGQRKALAIAVKGARTRRRWSKLRGWLAGEKTEY